MTTPTAYEILVELVAIRDLDRSKSMTTLEFDEYCARYDAADAPARACVAAGPGIDASVRAVVNEQAEDPALWLIQPTITEEYLQRALRRLHAVIEDARENAS